jgi:hypothetical protein
LSNEQRYFDALREIARAYASPDELRRTSERRYGLDGDEAIEMAYENVKAVAVEAIRGRRRPKQ